MNPVAGAHLRWLLRARDVLTVVLLTAMTVGLTGALALHDAGDRVLAASAILWLVVTLTALVAASRVLAAESTGGGLQALLLAPIPRRDLFLSRTLATLPLVLGLAAATWLSLIALFPDLGHLVSLAPVPALLLGAVGLAFLGSLAGWAALSSRAGELLGPALALPLAAPLVVACLHATEAALATGQLWGPSLTFALGYDLVVGALSYILAANVVEVSA